MTAGASGKAPSVAHPEGAEHLRDGVCECECRACWLDAPGDLGCCLCPPCTDDHHDHGRRREPTVMPRSEPVDCAWCGRAIALAPDGVTWLAVKAAERGYDPNFCEAVADGWHDPTDVETTDGR